MLLSNELPKLPDQSGALASRFLVWRFTRSFLGQEDLGLDARLAAELPGILLWAIEGWKRLRKRGHFLQPPSGRALVDEVRDISSPIGAFIRERVKVEVGATTDVADLFAEWVRWCEGKKRQPGDEMLFGRNLRTVIPGLETKTRRGKAGEKTWVRQFEGLRIKDDDYVSGKRCASPRGRCANVARSSGCASSILPTGHNVALCSVARYSSIIHAREKELVSRMYVMYSH